MELKPGIISLSGLILIGKRANMSFAADKTKALWQGFMPEVSKIKNRVGSDYYSVEIYEDLSFFKNFDPTAIYEKWAAISVSDLEKIPDGLESIKIPAGLYAVFPYKGKASEASKIYQYIFGAWIPNSGFTLHNRPHFAVMGEKYKNDDPASEEELWIPVRKK